VLYRQRFRDGPLGDGYDVVVCRQCGAGFAEGIPSQEELDRYYAGQSKYTYDHAGGAESPYDFKRFESIADQVIPFLPSREVRILDVGCATGGLLSVFKQRGFGNVLGVDPSPACVPAARRLHGVEVSTATLAQLAGWQESFDLILLVGVLEHLRDVQPAVRTVAGRLKAGGLLYCAQPDVTAFADCVNAPYQQFSVEHVNFFSEASLSRLMAACALAPRRTWRWMMEWREGVTDSVVSGIYSLSPSFPHSLTPSHPSAEVPSSKFQVSRIRPSPTVVPQVSSSRPSAEVPSSKFQVPRSQPSPTADPQIGSSVPSAEVPSPIPLRRGFGGQEFQVPRSNPPLSTFHLSPSAFRRPPSLTPSFPDDPPDRETEPALQRYLAKCGQEDLKLATAIEQLVSSQEPVFIWGVGTLTRRLLESTRLSEANIVAFVDSNPGMQGRRLAGRDILSPAQIAGRRETIVVCSKAFEREIIETIRNQLRLPNQVITLA
jgi:SAM-dependent methyltransferase